MPPVGILLAAGRGRRFDPTGSRNKLLEPLPSFGGEPVVAASARALLAVLPKVIAVVAPGDDAVAQLLRALGCDVTVCADADQGMAHSLVHVTSNHILLRLSSFAASNIVLLTLWIRFISHVL